MREGQALTRPAIVAAARGWLGTPYHHQASLRGVGCDCLGLLRGIWRELVGPEPEAAGPYAADWAEATLSERMAEAAARHLLPVAPADVRPGDVLLFRWRREVPAKHLAILSAADAMVHAHDGAAVSEVAFTPWWRRHLAYAFAFPGLL
jgi:NlpC/P60 family putative phage cell wall peptidase